MMVETSVSKSALEISPWQRFWFVAEPGAMSLRVIRSGLSAIAVWYFASHWLDIGNWFSESGILASARVGSFLDAGDLTEVTKWKWSPLYWIDSSTVLRVYLVIGILLAIAAAVIRRSRIPAVLLWLWCVWLANRSLLISGPEELALTFGLAYLAIASPSEHDHWTTALARRMIQVHTMLLIGLTGLTMLSAAIWWDGTGSVAVAAPVGRRLFDLSEILTSPWIHEPLTHAIVIVALAAPIAIGFRQSRFPAYVALLIWCLALALLSSQWMYFTTLAILVQVNFSAVGLRRSTSIYNEA